MTDKPLSKKHQRFIDEYFLCGMNATEAYFRTYKPKSRDTARANGADLLANTSIRKEIDARLQEVHMNADRALQLLSEHAEGSLEDFIEITPMGYHVSLEKAAKAGKLHLLKKVDQKTITINGKQEDKEIFTEKIELHDPQSALRDILKIHGKMKGDTPTVNVNISWKEFIDSAKSESDNK